MIEIDRWCSMKDVEYPVLILLAKLLISIPEFFNIPMRNQMVLTRILSRFSET